MAQLAFWAIWLLVGYVGAGAWLAAACPPAACSGILVGLQLPGLVLGFVGWLAIGIMVSVYLARDASPAQGPDPGTQAPAAGSLEPAEDETLDEEQLMRKYGIRREGERFAFGDYRYDRLRDALAYARLQKKRGG